MTNSSNSTKKIKLLFFVRQVCTCWRGLPSLKKNAKIRVAPMSLRPGCPKSPSTTELVYFSNLYVYPSHTHARSTFHISLHSLQCCTCGRFHDMKPDESRMISHCSIPCKRRQEAKVDFVRAFWGGRAIHNVPTSWPGNKEPPSGVLSGTLVRVWSGRNFNSVLNLHGSEEGFDAAVDLGV